MNQNIAFSYSIFIHMVNVKIYKINTNKFFSQVTYKMGNFSIFYCKIVNKKEKRKKFGEKEKENNNK